MKYKSKLKKAAITVAALLFWIVVWFLASLKIDSVFILPSPALVFPRLFALACTGEFYKVILISFVRITLGFIIGMVLGFFLGFLTHYIRPAKALFSPLMSIIRATPVASFILVIIFWIEREGVPSFISILMVLPIVWQNTELGLEKKDKGLEEVAKIYQLGKWKTLIRVDLPQVVPFVFSAGKTALGLAWKAGVAAEVLALPKMSIGMMIYNSKLYLEIVDLYAWTIAIIIFSVILEKLFSVIFCAVERRKHGND